MRTTVRFVEDLDGSGPFCATGFRTCNAADARSSNTECNIRGGIMATQFFAADLLLETQIIREFPDYNSDLF
jgi:hypothetical protein